MITYHILFVNNSVSTPTFKTLDDRQYMSLANVFASVSQFIWQIVITLIILTRTRSHLHLCLFHRHLFPCYASYNSLCRTDTH